MIFEKNPFTTAVSTPKSFHLAPYSPTFEIHQPTLILHHSCVTPHNPSTLELKFFALLKKGQPTTYGKFFRHEEERRMQKKMRFICTVRYSLH